MTSYKGRSTLAMLSDILHTYGHILPNNIFSELVQKKTYGELERPDNSD
jgi:hypothetical protein